MIRAFFSRRPAVTDWPPVIEDDTPTQPIPVVPPVAGPLEPGYDVPLIRPREPEPTAADLLPRLGRVGRYAALRPLDAIDAAAEPVWAAVYIGARDEQEVPA